MRKRLTKRSVAALPPAETVYRVYDAQLPRFGVRVSKTARAYFIDYHSPVDGARREYSLGPTHLMAPSVARDRARDLLRDIRQGKDPLFERRKAKAEAMRLSELWERYNRDVLENERPTIRKGRPPLKPLTVDSYRRVWASYVEPRLGRQYIKTIDRRTVNEFMERMKAKPTAANRSLSLLSVLFKYAINQDLREDNPTENVGRYREVKRKRYLNARELERLSVVLQDAKPWQTVAAVRLALLTGMRRGEILGLRWEHVDREAGLIHVPHAKGEARDVALSPPVLEILEGLPRHSTNPHVIAGETTDHPFQGLGKGWGRIRKAADLTDVRFHDLRHTAASLAVSSGMNLELLQVVLGHKDRRSTERYAHLWEEPQHAAAESMAQRMSELLGGEKHQTDGADVVDLDPRGGNR